MHRLRGRKMKVTDLYQLKNVVVAPELAHYHLPDLDHINALYSLIYLKRQDNNPTDRILSQLTYNDTLI